MSTKIYYLIVIIILTTTFHTCAQQYTKTEVTKMKRKNSGVIMDENDVKGYYFFYNQEKASSNLNNYLLTILDENLREINSTTITRPTSYNLIEGAFNGSAFCFLFYDSKSRSSELLSFDKELTQIGVSLKKLNNKFLVTSYNQLAMGVEASQNYLVPISGKGFLYYSLKEGKKQHYEIEFFDNNLNRVWSEQASETARIENAIDGFQNKHFIGSIILRKENPSSKHFENDLLIQNASNGNTLFKVPVVTSEYSVAINNVYYDSLNNNFLVFGEYFGKQDRELKDIGLGFITLVYDHQGKIINEIKNSWATEISKATPFDERGKFEGLDVNVLFHQAIRTSDGEIFMIGEQYKKAVSGAGVALKALSLVAAITTGYYTSSTSAMQLNIYNIVIFHFNPDYSINKVHVFEKSKNVVTLPNGWGNLSPKMLSYYAKSVGGFDFMFAQLSSDKSTFIANYINFDRSPETKSKNVLGSIVYTPEKTFVVDKMELSRKSTEYFINKAKHGHILVTEYLRKEKRIESRLEKINY